MSRYWIDPKTERVISLCDLCAAEPETARAEKERGWIEIRREDPQARARIREARAWFCDVCGAYL